MSLSEENQIVKNPNGCPCSDSCCNNPEVSTPDHVCDEGFCEECYLRECENCFSGCYCDL